MQDMAPEVRKRPFGRSLQDCRKEGMTTPHGLWPAEEKLLQAAAKGEPCAVGQKRPEASADDNKIHPLFLRFLLLGGDDLNPVHEKGVDIRGAFITGGIDLEGCQIGRSVRLLNCRVDGSLTGANAQFGELNLAGSSIKAIECYTANFRGNVFLSNGFEAEGLVRFLGAVVGGQLNCQGGKFKNAAGTALACDNAKVTGTVYLCNGFEAEGAVSFLGGEIGGGLDCTGGKFKGAAGNALACDSLKVTASVILRNVEAEGAVRFLGAEIGGGLDCTDAKLKNAAGNALACDSAKVTAGILLRNLQAEGAVSFLGGEIGGGLDCTGAKFKNAAGNALACDSLKITASVLLRNFEAEGGVRFFGAEIGGWLDCTGAKFKDAARNALTCDSAKVTGGVLLKDFEAEGAVSFIGAEVGGQLICQGGKLKNEIGNTLVCDSAKVTGAVFLSSDFEGVVRFFGADITGVLNCEGGKFRNANGYALVCNTAKVTSDVLLSNGFEAEGIVSFAGANIGGMLNCQGGKFKNTNGYPFFCANAKITGDVLLSNGFEAEGETAFDGTEIGGDLSCWGGKFANKGDLAAGKDGGPKIAGYALSLGGARVNGVMRLGQLPPNEQLAEFEGSINLLGAHAHQFIDDIGSWPPNKVGKLTCVIDLDGFTYDRLGSGAPADAETREKWLRRQPQEHRRSNFRPQPFEQLVKVLQEMGHTRDAKEIGYFKEYYRLRKPWRHWWQWANPLYWLLHFCRWLLLEQALGHGYRPHRMVFLAIAVFAAFGFVYGEAARQGLFAPSNPRVFMDKLMKDACTENDLPQWTASGCNLNARVPEYTKFNPYVYSLDVILPIVSLKQREDWQPVSRPLRLTVAGESRELPPYFVRLLVWIESIFAWVWTLSLSAVATGIIKRD